VNISLNLNQFSNDQLFASLEREFALERQRSHQILLHLKEIRSRRLYATRGFSSMFSMLVQRFGQSESSANQRLKALDLMMDVPRAEAHLLSGQLSMSTAAMAQRQIKREEKLIGKSLTQDKKAEIVEAICGKTMAFAEIELFRHLPETSRNPQFREYRISTYATRMSLTVPDDVREMMIRLKELWAHADPSMDFIEIMRRSFKIALEKVDPSIRSNAQGATESAKHRGATRLRYYGKDFDRELWQRAGSRCEYVDEVTGRRCDCKFGLQREHVIPLGKGGNSELSNMQLLCATHNHLRARLAFGDEHVDEKINATSSREGNRRSFRGP
jgi:hypothetical protein